jgi:hypothetical protein
VEFSRFLFSDEEFYVHLVWRTTGGLFAGQEVKSAQTFD